MDTPVARALVEELRRRGHEPVVHGALAEGERADWAWACERAARDVAEGEARAGRRVLLDRHGRIDRREQGRGRRAALCADAETARGARTWNDANVLALSLRTTSEPLLEEILDGWFATGPSDDPADRANVEHVDELDATRAGD